MDHDAEVVRSISIVIDEKAFGNVEGQPFGPLGSRRVSLSSCKKNIGARCIGTK